MYPQMIMESEIMVHSKLTSFHNLIQPQNADNVLWIFYNNYINRLLK